MDRIFSACPLLTKRLLLMLLPASLWPFFTFAQPDPAADFSPYREKFQYYTGVKISYQTKKKWSGAVEYLYRTKYLMNGMEGSFLYAHLRYKVNRHLSPEIKFRYVTTNSRDHYRYEAGLRFTYKYKKIGLLYRPAFFHEYEYVAPAYEPGHEPTNYLRNRLQFSWNVSKRFDTYFSAETYSRFTNKHTELRRIAYIAGMEIKLNRNINLNLYYLLQPEFNQQDPKRVHAAGTTLDYVLQKQKKKKKKADYF